MKIHLLDKTKKKNFIEEVSYLGVEKIPFLLAKAGKERVAGFSGSLTNEEIMHIWRMFPIEGFGLYFGKELIDRHGKKEARLSLDALHVLKDQIKGNIVELDEKQEEEWFAGKDIEGIDSFGFVAVKSGEDFIGAGKVSGEGLLINMLPKERRRKD